jgi:hypothetical protein
MITFIMVVCIFCPEMGDLITEEAILWMIEL